MTARSRLLKASTAPLGVNAHLIGKPHSRERLATPALVLDLDAMEHNLCFMAEYYKKHGRSLRPHAKTHKSVRIAALQARHGAIGVATATLREATVMVAAGLKGLLITSPVVGEVKLDALVRLLEVDKDVMIAVDSAANALALETRLAKGGTSVRVLIDIDPGMRRTGVPSAQRALALGRRLALMNRLELVGVQCYSGMVQHIDKYAERISATRTEFKLLEAVLEGLSREGSGARIVSGGGTGTFDIDRRDGLYTEGQAGSYIFMDAQYNAVRLVDSKAAPFKSALFVQSMVLSNNHPATATIDAGFKSFAMDGPLPVPHSGAPRGSRYTYYGDEFGMLNWPSKAKTLKLGAKVEFIAPHCDPTVNLHNYYHCVRGERLVDIWPIDARGHL